jgi:hypothetical protein
MKVPFLPTAPGAGVGAGDRRSFRAANDTAINEKVRSDGGKLRKCPNCRIKEHRTMHGERERLIRGNRRFWRRERGRSLTAN